MSSRNTQLSVYAMSGTLERSSKKVSRGSLMRRWITALMLGLFLIAFGHSLTAFADDEGGDPHGNSGFGHHH